MTENQSKAAFVHDVFAEIADKYDTMNSVLSFWQHKFWRRFAMKIMNLKRGQQALDVAAGTGDWSFALAHAAGPTGKVTGLDFCQEMLDVATLKAQRQASSDAPIEWICGDAMNLPFADDTFDVATIGFALRNVPDISTVLGEMKRVLRPGGQVVSLELSKPENTVFRKLYYFYFYRIVPRLGALAVGSKQPYAWLPASLTNFPNRKQLEDMFRAVGLTEVKSYPLAGGISALHVGRKPIVRNGAR